MKKIIMLVMLLVFAVTFAQQKKTAKTAAAPAKKETAAAKPTKQETMDWIGEKMKENLGPYKSFVSYKDGVYTFKVNGSDCSTVIDLNKVTGMSSEYSSDFFISGKKLLITTCGGNQIMEFISLGGPNYNEYTTPFRFNTDTALVERLKKAFTSLIEFNSVKKANEAY